VPVVVVAEATSEDPTTATSTAAATAAAAAAAAAELSNPVWNLQHMQVRNALALTKHELSENCRRIFSEQSHFYDVLM
jgi:hypothetical protein